MYVAISLWRKAYSMHIGRGIRVPNYSHVPNVTRSSMSALLFIPTFRPTELTKTSCVISVGAHLKANRVLECIRRGIIWTGVMCASIAIKPSDAMTVWNITGWCTILRKLRKESWLSFRVHIAKRFWPPKLSLIGTWPNMASTKSTGVTSASTDTVRWRN